jgi:branched-chain amino acid transport system permease protein
MNYAFHLLILIEIYLLLAVSLNLIVGYGGLVSLAHASFYGIGAYTASLLMLRAGWSFSLALIAAIAACVISSLAISLATSRFRGDQFILVTLGFQVIIYSLFNNWIGLTNGPFGISGIPRPSFGKSVDFLSMSEFALLGFLFVIVVLLAFSAICHSPYGRALRAVRDDEVAAVALGKSPRYLRSIAVIIGSATAGIAGMLYASYVGFIDPGSFTVDESLLLLSMVIVGGTGNLKGPVVGAILLVLLPEAMRFLAIPAAASGHVRLALYGLMLVVLMRVKPEGLVGSYRFE